MCNHCNLYENCLFCTSRACLQVERVGPATTLAKSKKEAETAIQLWLRRASDRNTYQMNKKL
ncbi:unnamed protein product [Acanthoscelides obtectus]|uniref:Uncharacterized protein n=2 Tax=Acanthoscelides obtectus TaxID=200917 RepID=A0A9P0PWY4_ACAOB|nr:unnamed protein product [Acanthoscelides obtectus]CAK1670092.1 hypothetical protein AOBTE_LOCUS27394 [Acanthoscelides obtectus]